MHGSPRPVVARMLGAFAYDKAATYICNEPAEMTYEDLHNLGVELSELSSGLFNCVVYNAGSRVEPGAYFQTGAQVMYSATYNN